MVVSCFLFSLCLSCCCSARSLPFPVGLSGWGVPLLPGAQLCEIGPPRSDDISIVSAACYEQDILSTLLLGCSVSIWPTQ